MPTHWWAEMGGRISSDRVLAVPELVCLPAVGKAGPGAGGWCTGVWLQSGLPHVSAAAWRQRPAPASSGGQTWVLRWSWAQRVLRQADLLVGGAVFQWPELLGLRSTGRWVGPRPRAKKLEGSLWNGTCRCPCPHGSQNDCHQRVCPQPELRVPPPSLGAAPR